MVFDLFFQVDACLRSCQQTIGQVWMAGGGLLQFASAVCCSYAEPLTQEEVCPRLQPDRTLYCGSGYRRDCGHASQEAGGEATSTHK
jgi:hypothetical protein